MFLVVIAPVLVALTAVLLSFGTPPDVVPYFACDGYIATCTLRGACQAAADRRRLFPEGELRDMLDDFTDAITKRQRNPGGLMAPPSRSVRTPATAGVEFGGGGKVGAAAKSVCTLLSRFSRAFLCFVRPSCPFSSPESYPT